MECMTYLCFGKCIYRRENIATSQFTPKPGIVHPILAKYNRIAMMKSLVLFTAILISTVAATFYKPTYNKKYRKPEMYHLVKASEPYFFKPEPSYKESPPFHLVKASHDSGMYDPMMHREAPKPYHYPEQQPYHERPYVGGAEYPGYGPSNDYGFDRGMSDYTGSRFGQKAYPGAKYRPSFKKSPRSGKLY